MKSRARPFLFILFAAIMICSYAQGSQDLIPDVPACGHLVSSAKANYTIDIGPQVSAAYLSLNWKKAGSVLELALLSPSGKWIHTGPGSSINRISGQTSDSYVIPFPEKGEWVVQVRSMVIKEGEDYCLSAALDRAKASFNGIYRNYGTDENGDGKFEDVTLAVGIDVYMAGNYSVDGLIYDLKSGQENHVSNQTYLDIGSRTLNLDLYGLRSPGPYRLKHLDLYDEMGNKMDTSAANYTTRAYDKQMMSNHSARLNGNYSDYGSDANGDGLYDYLTVDVGIEVLKPGNYSLTGYLYDAKGSNAVWSEGYASLSPGNSVIHLDFDGKTLWGRKFNGTYNLKDLELSRGDSEKENFSLEDVAVDAYTTKQYNYTQFVDPAWPEKTLSGSGKGEILLTIFVKSILPVFRGRYSLDLVGVNMPPISSNWTAKSSNKGHSYDLPGIHMPTKPNNFTILAKGVKNLHVGVRKDPIDLSPNYNFSYSRTWVSTQATAGADGIATISNDMISPGRYQFKVFGDAAENASRVDLELNVVKKLVIDGSFKLALNMSGFPSGNYSFDAKALNGSLRLDEIGMGDSY